MDSGFAQTEQSEQIEAHRRMLLGPDPAPPGHRSRRVALTALVEMDQDAAHAVLADVLHRFPNPQLATFGTITNLLELLTTRAAVDLQKLVDPKNKAEVVRRVEIYRGYVPRLVRLSSVARSDTVPAEQQRSLVGEIELFFKTLPGEVRRPELHKLFGAAGALQSAAVRIAGATEDPQIAPLLAPLLADQKLRPIVQDALGNLTQRLVAFADAADFDAWWQKHSAKSYSELIHEAARQGRAIAKNLEQRFAEERRVLVDRLVTRAERVLTLAVARPVPDWKLVRAELQDPVLAEHGGRLMEAFYGAMRVARVDEKELKRTIGELSELRKWFADRYQSATARDRTAGLSAWAIASKLLGGASVPEARIKLLALLDAERGRDSVPMGRLLELLTLFPDDTVRDRVLGVLERAPASAAFLPSGLTAIGGLGMGGVGPRTITLLRRIVETSDVAPKTRGLALDVLGHFDGAEVLATLHDLVLAPKSSALPEGLRATALAWVVTQVEGQLQTRANGDLEKLARQTLQLLGVCIVDPSARIRRDAAQTLEKFPPVSASSSFSKQFLSDVATTIVSKAAHRLRNERDGSVVRQLRAVLLGQAQRSEVSSLALEKLVVAVVGWKKDTGTGANGAAATFLDAQLQPAIRDIEQLLKGKSVEPAATQQLARMLVENGLPDVGRVVLAAAACAKLDRDPGGSDDQERTRYAALRLERAKLVLRLVEAAGDPEALPEPRRAQIDGLLVSAQNGIVALGKEAPWAQARLGGALLLSGRAADAARVLDGYLKTYGADASPQLQQRTRRLLAEAWTKTGKPAAAAKLLEQQRDLPSLQLRAEALLQASDYAAAEKAFSDLLKSPDLAKEGSQREHAQLGFATSLVKQDKLELARQFLAKLPKLTDAAAKTKLLSLESELKTRKDGKPANGAKPPRK